MTYHGHYTRAKANTTTIAYRIGQIHEHLRKHQLCMCMVSPKLDARCSLYMQHSGSKEGGGTEIDDLVARMLTCIIVVYLLHQHELSIKMLTNDMHATVCFVAKKSTKARGTPRFHIFFTNEAHFLVQNTTYMHHLSIHV